MLFDRVAELEIGQSGSKGILIKDLRFAFNIEKTSSETLNSSTVKIYNLNLSSRKLIAIPNNILILRAGYAQDVGAITIFTGSVRRALTMREGVDWITELQLDDGLIAYRDSKISLSFAVGVSALSVLKTVAGQFNLPVGTLPLGIVDKAYTTGFSFVGRVREAMAKVCAYLGLEWSIQNQQIQIIKKGGTVKNQIVLLSPESGLIGSPAFESKTMNEKAAAKKSVTTDSKGKVVKSGAKGDVKQRLQVEGFTATSLLQPTIQCGNVIKLKAEGIEEFLKVEKLTHNGDTHGAEWTTELTLRYL